VWSGHLSLKQGLGLASVVDDSTFGEELRKIGYFGQYPADHHLNPLSGHFELHIEQGPRLEQGGAKIGVVKGIQGNRRYGVTIRGEKAHAGSACMDDRTDALTAAAKIIVRVEDLAKQTRGFATVGVIHLEDASINCVPGHVYFTIDIRHPSAELLDLSEQSLFSEMRGLEQDKPKLKFDVVRLWESPAAQFSTVAFECVSAAAVARVGAGKTAELISFAGHDSAMTALRVPTAMLFVPSKNGISHAPAEFTSQEQWYV
jgi:N-carbamoyl-L-amino-acid hydrolase